MRSENYIPSCKRVETRFAYHVKGMRSVALSGAQLQLENEAVRRGADSSLRNQLRDLERSRPLLLHRCLC